jgi:tRNA/tmRNA/rRNA uracil-C5-methylase (TrmA/RlmC/RlmD family)
LKGIYKGDRFDVKIEGYNSEGAGVAKFKDSYSANPLSRVIFVNNAVRGEFCVIGITGVFPNYCTAKIIQRKKPSKNRITPDCRYYGRCGGCNFRHVTYEEELFAKRDIVNSALKRIGGLSVEIEDIYTTGEIIGYRNNVQLKSEDGKIGFYAKSSHDIVEIDKCLLANDKVNAAIRAKDLKTLKIRSDTEKIGDLTLKISPDSFFQVNSKAAEILFGKVREFAALKPPRLVYVSCNPSTLARDLKLFGEHGYKVARICAVDMFPRTKHIECVVLLKMTEK